MFASKVNEVIISEMKAFFDDIEEKYPELVDVVTSEELQEDLKVFLDKVSSKTPGKKVVKEKKKREVKEIPEDEKCLALKKDGTQCNGRRHVSGEIPELCTLHNRSGPTYGRIGDDVVAETIKKTIEESSKKSVPEIVKGSSTNKNVPKKKKASESTKAPNTVAVSNSVTCPYTFTKGKSKGEICGKLVNKDSVYCKSHEAKLSDHVSDTSGPASIVESDAEGEDLFGEIPDDDCESDVDRYEYHSDTDDK